MQDDENLPEGMKRVGYDADTQTYTYHDQDGSLWEGEPGSRYGVLRQTRRLRPYHYESNINSIILHRRRSKSAMSGPSGLAHHAPILPSCLGSCVHPLPVSWICI